MNRKFRKLLRDPKLFFRDMYNKRSIQIKKYLLIKYNGTQQYTVVSAVYNVEKYLNDYFSSLTKQSLNFKKHIQLILVDDGSTDRQKLSNNGKLNFQKISIIFTKKTAVRLRLAI